MSKGGKIVIFIIVSLVVVIVATALKESGAGAVLSIGGVAILILYQAMFKKKEQPEKSDEQTDITLKK